MIRKARAVWRGTGRDGNGDLSTDSGVLDASPYSFRTRFEGQQGTNPEELIAAAHAGCFSMAFSHGLAGAGHKPTRVHTVARVHLDKQGGGFAITRIELECDAEVPGIDEKTFQEQAQAAKANCPVSKALAGTEITLKATLK